MDTSSLSERFQRFADRECRGSSPLYEHLARQLAADEPLLRIAAHARLGQPMPNLFLAAVHYLLLQGADHPLRSYYASLVEQPVDVETSYACFREFCLLHEQEIVGLIRHRLVQTNEVRRCAYLYPGFCLAFEQTNRLLACVELGTSAGLQLLWDQYAYSYGTADVHGNSNSPLHIRSELRGERMPRLFKQSPPVAARIGIDLHPNDLSSPDDGLWLNALIWPEHSERRRAFEQAAQLVKGQSLKLVEGNGITLLPEIASRISHEHVLCIFHTHVANQFTPDEKTALLEQVKQIGQTRDVFHLYNQMWDGDLHLDGYVDGVERRQTLAETDGHGRWFRWLMPM